MGENDHLPSRGGGHFGLTESCHDHLLQGVVCDLSFGTGQKGYGFTW